MTHERTDDNSRTILLLSDDPSATGRIHYALDSFCMSHHFLSHASMNDYHQSLIDSELLTSTTGSVDLFLIAYLDNIKLTLETVADLRKTRRYALTPVVAFQESEDRESTRALYHRGVNTVIKYPPSFDMLRQLVEIMDSYWFDTVSLPGHSNEPW